MDEINPQQIIQNFFDNYGFDANIVKIYDDMIDDVAKRISKEIKKNISIICDKNSQECIKTASTYNCQFVIEHSEVITSLPIPVGSRHGISDTRKIKGYFIIDGKKKVLVSQERRDFFKIIVYLKNDVYQCETRIVNDEGEVEILEVRIDKDKMIMRINSMIHKYGTEEKLNKNNESSSSDKDHSEKDDVTFHALRHAKRPKKIWMDGIEFLMKFIGRDWKNNLLYHTKYPKIVDTFLIELSINGSRKQTSYYDFQINNYLLMLPKQAKISMICIVVCRIIETKLGLRPVDDVDDPIFKRIDTPADFVWRAIGGHINKSNFIENLERRSIKILQRFKSGKWVSKYGSEIHGISQALSTKSDLDSLSHIRRIGIPLDPNTTNANIRKVHVHNLGFICPCETPEGRDVGITKYLASTCIISSRPMNKSHAGERVCLSTLKTFIINSLSKILPTLPDGALPAKQGFVFLDGFLKGKSLDCNHLIEEFYKFRNTNASMAFVSVFTDSDGDIHFLSDSGRLCRPLLTSDFNVRFVDMAEQSNASLFSSYKQYIRMCLCEAKTQAQPARSFIEIHASTMFGLIASTLPFSNHNQSPRIIFQSSMSKQAISLNPEEAQDIPYDTKILVYGQKPLCTTQISDILSIDENPNGINVNVAILCYTGYNQEDAIIFNKSSVERGMFSNIRYDTIEIFENIHVQETLVNVSSDFDIFDEDGIIRKGQILRKDDIIATKYCPQEKEGNFEKIKTKMDNVIVESVEKIKRDNGSRIVRIKVRSVRMPIVGDKFTSRHSQKGITSILMNAEDMPFDEEGIIPDIIINPHCIPSRMTIGQLLEMVFSTEAAKGGWFIDGTPFSERELMNSEISKKILYCGITGEIMKCKVFTGLCYYQALRHQAKEKAFSRSEGSLQAISRQPVEGRSRGGGLRFGEMEKDCLISHGATSLILDKLMNDSDPVNIEICEKCSMTEIISNICTNCGYDKTITIKIPYSLRLLSQEMAMANMKLLLRPTSQVDQ